RDFILPHGTGAAGIEGAVGADRGLPARRTGRFQLWYPRGPALRTDVRPAAQAGSADRGRPFHRKADGADARLRQEAVSFPPADIRECPARARTPDPRRLPAA